MRNGSWEGHSMNFPLVSLKVFELSYNFTSISITVSLLIFLFFFSRHSKIFKSSIGYWQLLTPNLIRKTILLSQDSLSGWIDLSIDSIDTQRSIDTTVMKWIFCCSFSLICTVKYLHLLVEFMQAWCTFLQCCQIGWKKNALFEQNPTGFERKYYTITNVHVQFR